MSTIKEGKMANSEKLSQSAKEGKIKDNIRPSKIENMEKNMGKVVGESAKNEISGYKDVKSKECRIRESKESPEQFTRPHIRKEVRDAVEAKAPKDSQGKFLDANTGLPINGKHDLGHKPGHEFRKEAQKAKADGLTQAEFNERMNDPKYYQIEDPSSNRSHQFENKD